MFYLTTQSAHLISSYMALDIINFIHPPTDRIAHTTTFVTAVVELRMEREIAQRVHYEGSI